VGIRLALEGGRRRCGWSTRMRTSTATACGAWCERCATIRRWASSARASWRRRAPFPGAVRRRAHRVGGGGPQRADRPGKAPGRPGGLQLVDFVPGAAMLVRRRVFDDIGLLPEEFFLYFEETEFCVRAAVAGWKVAVEPSALAVHRFASADGLPTETLLYYFIRNRLLFGQKRTDRPFEALLADLEGFIASWRRRVEERNPQWMGASRSWWRWRLPMPGPGPPAAGKGLAPGRKVARACSRRPTVQRQPRSEGQMQA